MHSDTYNELMTARAEGEPEPEPTLIVQAQGDCPTLETYPAPAAAYQPGAYDIAPAADDITHYVGDDCPGGHFDDPVAVPVEADPYLLSPPPPRVDGVTDGTTFYVRNGVRIAFPGDHTADEVEEAFRGAGF